MAWTLSKNCVRSCEQTLAMVDSDSPKKKEVWRVASFEKKAHVPWSKVAILGMVIPPLIGILIMGI